MIVIKIITMDIYIFRCVQKHAHLDNNCEAQLYFQVHNARRVFNPLSDQQHQRHRRLHQATSTPKHDNHILF